MQIKLRSPLVWLTTAWIGGVIVGMGALTDFSSAPGIAAVGPGTWPAGLALRHSTSMPSLVMFVHPQCACSNASLAELARLAARSRDRVDLTVLFVKPPGTPRDWQKTDLWTRAALIPGVRVDTDQDGLLASRFGATTSGHCFVYDAQGGLIFSGGITAGRGHEGDCPGQTMIQLIAFGQTGNGTKKCPTFGCPLMRPSSSPLVTATASAR